MLGFEDKYGRQLCSSTVLRPFVTDSSPQM